LKKRVLVTGGAGFISSNFIRHLLATHDHEVVSLDALRTRATSRTSRT
jgi:dTDP-glucose 4,6-dehydratase